MVKTQRGAMVAPHAELDFTFTFTFDILPNAMLRGAKLII